MLPFRSLVVLAGLLVAAGALGQAGTGDTRIVAASGVPITDLKTLAARVAEADVLLLGEVHDNVKGHSARTTLLQVLAREAARPTVLAMEHFDVRDQQALDRARAAQPNDVTAWIEATSPGNRWPWKLVRPALELARDASWSLRAANLSRTELRANDRRDGLPQMPSAALATLAETISVGHCGMLSPAQVEAIAQLQRRRDAAMAEVLLDSAAAGKRVILLAGNGHVRKDFGVPRYLTSERSLRIVSIGFAEHANAEEAGVYDYVVGVPAQVRADPCASLREPRTRK